MATVAMKCPSCGAPVQMPFGKRFCFCEFCGGQVKEQLSDEEFKHVVKNKDFVESIKSAIQCIVNGDYDTAIEYADKAAAINNNDPAPTMIKYVATLNLDIKKASSFRNIASSMRAQSESEAIPEAEYPMLLSTFANNYFKDRSEDINRMFINLKRIKASDIDNVRVYERSKIQRYYEDSELKDAFNNTINNLLDDFEKDLPSSQQMTAENWNSLENFHRNRLFMIAGMVFANPAIAPRAKAVVMKYSNALNMKWESAFKSGVPGSKDQVREYRTECSSFLSWLGSVRG